MFSDHDFDTLNDWLIRRPAPRSARAQDEQRISTRELRRPWGKVNAGVAGTENLRTLPQRY
jgi:hypothetical protein